MQPQVHSEYPPYLKQTPVSCDHLCVMNTCNEQLYHMTTCILHIAQLPVSYDNLRIIYCDLSTPNTCVMTTCVLYIVIYLHQTLVSSQLVYYIL